eukprot:902334-Pleurochrysis_carterae.AAC.1
MPSLAHLGGDAGRVPELAQRAQPAHLGLGVQQASHGRDAAPQPPQREEARHPAAHTEKAPTPFSKKQENTTPATRRALKGVL